MKKIDSSYFVCSANQTQQLIGLGILPVACHCYETVGGLWEYAGEYVGEYVGQTPVIPAWTMNELAVLIGGDYAKPDLYSVQEWKHGLNMNQWVLYLPKKMIEFINAAEAYAALLIFLLTEKHLKPDECNARLIAFADRERYNPQSDILDAKNID